MGCTVGISAGFHDAGLSVINEQGKILYASHSERYSKQKSDPNICPELANVLGYYNVSHIAYYERPFVKQLRQLYTGQGVEWDKLLLNQVLRKQLGDQFDSFKGKTSCYNHHLSHAAAGFQTSPFNKATVVVIDAIGEFDTISIYGAEYDQKGLAKYKKLWGQKYPHSIGLFYTAMTQEVGLRPLDEEYILMGMAAYGSKHLADMLKQDLVSSMSNLTMKLNMHTGFHGEYLSQFDKYDLAASAQALVEKLIYSVMKIAQNLNYSDNLVYMGGVALNCLANRNLGKYFSNIWIMPNPGDAGSSLGAAALAHGKALKWEHPYLGNYISGPYPTTKLLNELLANQIVGVANGQAEFGPRALGNRSLLADPRGTEIKDKVNEIKQRQKFRPFAPIILEEHVNKYFDMPKNLPKSPYMQVVARCRDPHKYPAIVHHDGTSRVQTVPKNCVSGIRELLEAWYAVTGCPMLLNTSLNIRGEPIVNDVKDAQRFEKQYNVKVYS
jgi:carbamoyltransferase